MVEEICYFSSTCISAPVLREYRQFTTKLWKSNVQISTSYFSACNLVHKGLKNVIKSKA